MTEPSSLIKLGRDALVTLMLFSDTMSKPPLIFKSSAMDKLVREGLARFEDRDDGRYYALTAEGKEVQPKLVELVAQCLEESEEL